MLDAQQLGLICVDAYYDGICYCVWPFFCSCSSSSESCIRKGMSKAILLYRCHEQSLHSLQDAGPSHIL